MNKRYDTDKESVFTRELLIGLGESSVRKSHYPELQRRLGELERFHLLLDQALDAIFLLDALTGTIMYANSTAREYCHCRQDELIDVTINRWLTFPNQSCFTASSALMQSFRSEECKLTRQDGISMPVEVSVNRVSLQHGEYVVIVARDITERKRTEEHHRQVHEELHANYEELEYIYGQLSSTEESMRQKVAELEESQAALAESEVRYRLAIEGANDAIWDWDICRGQWTVSNRWLEKLGLPTDPVNYLTYLETRVHPDDAVMRKETVEAHLKGKTEYYQAEYRIQIASGQYIWILSKGKALFDQSGKPIRMSGSYTDISELKRQQDHIAYIAFHDGLTGLPNRFRLKQVINVISGKSVIATGGILLLNLDNFKLVNDSWGHSLGDKLLKEVASRLRNFEKQGVAAYRLGGDEFVLVVDALTDESVPYWTEKVLALFDSPVTLPEFQLPLSASVGVALFFDGMNLDDVLRYADIALHEAKTAGKQTWRLYQPEMQKPILERIRLENDLRKALKDEQFVLYFQPQYSLCSSSKSLGFPVAMEALIRWEHPTLGLVPPLSFIPIAEETGIIVSVGDWVLRSACQFGRMYTERNGGLRVSVNVSALQLMQDDFAQRVLAIIEQENFPPELLELEITETVLMESIEENVRKLKELRNRGISIALDDFGTGYSSLTYLSRLPIDTLKIDKSFLHEASKQANSSIVGIIIQLAHELKLSVVAEGVETVDQLLTLHQLGCDYIQGYLTNPPLPIEQAQLIRRESHPIFGKSF